jgi:hypothetical protein
MEDLRRLWKRATKSDASIAFYFGVVPLVWFFTGGIWMSARYEEEDFLMFFVIAIPGLLMAFVVPYVGIPIVYRVLREKFGSPRAVVLLGFSSLFALWLCFETAEIFYEMGREARCGTRRRC